MASQHVTVQWIRPQRYEGVIEKIARSRIRGKVEVGGEARAMWRGKPYKVKIVDQEYLSQQKVVAPVRRKPVTKPSKVSKTVDTAASKRSPSKEGRQTQTVPITYQTTNIAASGETSEAMPSSNTRHRATRRPSLPGSPSPVRDTTLVKAVVHAPPIHTKIERPTTTSRTTVTEPDSSSPTMDSSVSSINSTNKPSKHGRPANGPYTPPLDRLDPKVAKYLKGIEERVVRLEELYKASKKK